ncbi:MULTISPECIES: STAS domain-containing protein [unclassified Streptomyces]|uniref:STAS domain-containing protein n=1 Tax=unclassified Streptomyces TaxID=2593676 RepID=UPI002E2AF0AD|nr:STAS domain-containing protein [Streptomyces sp. NBC_00272]
MVRPYGETDIDSAGHFREVLLAALSNEQRTHDVMADLQHLSFCDSSGLPRPSDRSSCSL